MADECYLLVHAAAGTVSHGGWTAEEAGMTADHRWWSVEDLTHTGETVWPDSLVAPLERAGAVQIG